MKTVAGKILMMSTCMSTGVIEYALCSLNVRSAVESRSTQGMKTEWDVDAAISTYNVDGWGTGYFTINNAGNVEVRPLQEKGGAIDILEVVNEARTRGLG